MLIVFYGMMIVVVEWIVQRIKKKAYGQKTEHQ